MHRRWAFCECNLKVSSTDRAMTNYFMFLCWAHMSVVSKSCSVHADACWKGSLHHLPGCEALLTWRALSQCQWGVHHSPRQAWGQTGKRLHGLLQTSLKLIWMLTNVLFVFAGWPRRCFTGVSEEVQAACWCVRHWCHLQSVYGWRAYNHCT